MNDCERFCTEEQQPYVRLGYTEGSDTSITVFTPWGSNTLDLGLIIKKGETDTDLFLNEEAKQLEYSSEKFHTTNGTGREKDIIDLLCMWSLMKIEDHGNAQNNPGTGDVYMYNKETGMWELYDLKTIITALQAKDASLTLAIENLIESVVNLGNRVTKLEGRVNFLENLIYNFGTDKTTPIMRGNMRLEYSNDNGSTYPWWMAGADDNGNNVIRGRVN